MIIGVTFMQENPTNYLDELTVMTSNQQDRVFELQNFGGCMHIAIEELQE